MPIFFPTAPGKVIRIDSLGLLLPFQISLGGWGGFSVQQSIITQGGIQLDGNFQFLHTLNDFIFVYTFGDRIGELIVSGVTFLDNCPTTNGQSGFESVLQYYYNNRIANLGTPVKCSFGNTALGVFQGFLTGMKADVINPESMLGQFTYRLNVFPVAAPVASNIGGTATASAATPASAAVAAVAAAAASGENTAITFESQLTSAQSFGFTPSVSELTTVPPPAAAAEG